MNIKLSLILLGAALMMANGLAAQKWKDKLNKAKGELLGESGLSEEEAGKGLKQALDLGVEEAVSFLSAEDGYYKSPYQILLPEEVQDISKKLRSVPGFANVEEELKLKINRAAEDAASKAKPIFVSAIKQMTFKDALSILSGQEDAATRYLEKATYDQLYEEFRPVIIASLDEVNAREYWSQAVTAYNKIPFTQSANPELDDYVTRQALKGMFELVEVKEQDIRQNTGARTTELLRKVFAQQD